MLEATLQAPLDPVVGGMVGVQIRAFRQLIATQVRATPRFADPEAVALVVAAALDGLLLHALAEPGTDLARAAEGFRELLRAGDVPKP